METENKKNILLVEDEKNFGTVLRDYLTMNNYSVTWCEDGAHALDVIKRNSFDLCLLDVMMPKVDGFTLASELKILNSEMPFIFLTARNMKEDVLKGYKLGADDYITKPFDSEVMLMKINVVLQRKQKVVKNISLYNVGKFCFDPKLRSLKCENKEAIKLSPKEASLLQLLCEHKNDVLPREKALKLIWKDDSYFTARSMDVYITKLRKYLSDDAHVSIENVHGNGYSLIEKI